MEHILTIDMEAKKTVSISFAGTMRTAEKVNTKTSARKPYSLLPSRSKQDKATLDADLERLVKESLDEVSKQPSPEQ